MGGNAVDNNNGVPIDTLVVNLTSIEDGEGEMFEQVEMWRD